MNRQQLRDRVVANTRRTDRVADIDLWIDDGLREISQLHDFRFNKMSGTAPLVSGAFAIDLPADLFQLYTPVRLLDTGSTELSRVVPLMDRDIVLSKYPNRDQNITGFPEICYVEGNTLVFVPPTSQDWTVYIDYFRLTPATTDASTTIQSGIETAIIAYVTAEVFRSTQQWQDCKEWMGEYGRRIGIAIAADKRVHTSRARESYVQPGNNPPFTRDNQIAGLET